MNKESIPSPRRIDVYEVTNNRLELRKPLGRVIHSQRGVIGKKTLEEREALREFCLDNFEYRQEGFLIRKKAGLGIRVGVRCGAQINGGYINLKIKGQLIREHQIIFLMHYGYVPPMLDHINEVKGDNRIENLRPADGSKNKANVSPVMEGTRSGWRGVTWGGSKKGWRVRYKSCTSKYNSYEKTFKNMQDAIVYASWRRAKMFGEYAHKIDREKALEYMG